MRRGRKENGGMVEGEREKGEEEIKGGEETKSEMVGEGGRREKEAVAE